MVTAGCNILAPSLGAAETLDRIVASVGNIAITRSEVETEWRFEKFLEGAPQTGEPAPQDMEQARDRLVRQILLNLEAEAEGLEAEASAAEASQALEQVRRAYPSSAAYEAALNSTGLSETLAIERLQRHLRTLRLIDQRLRPSAWVDYPEIEAYYRETFLPDFQQSSRGPAPGLPEVEDKIREILVQKRMNELLDDWLKEIEASRQVRLHSF